MTASTPDDPAAPPPPADAAPWQLDATILRRRHEASAATAATADTLSALTRAELLDRLSLVRRTPGAVLDAGGGDGQGAVYLARRYPAARTVLLDHALGRCRRARRRRGWRRRFEVIAADLQRMPFATGAFDMVFANLALQDCLPPDAALRECRRVLAEGGLFTFATLGPATLAELRAAWAGTGDAHERVHTFVDMHDLGEALGRCGFRDPVLDVDRHVLTYASADALATALRRAGATCAARGRAPGLTGARRWHTVRAALSGADAGAGVCVTVEVVYGHAWATGTPSTGARTPPGGSDEDQEVRVPLAGVRRRAPFRGTDGGDG